MRHTDTGHLQVNDLGHCRVPPHSFGGPTKNPARSKRGAAQVQQLSGKEVPPSPLREGAFSPLLPDF